MAEVFTKEDRFILLIAGYSKMRIPKQLALIIKAFGYPLFDYHNYEKDWVEIDEESQIFKFVQPSYRERTDEEDYRAVFGIDTAKDKLVKIRVLTEEYFEFFFGIIDKKEVSYRVRSDIACGMGDRFVALSGWNGCIAYSMNFGWTGTSGIDYGDSIKVNDIITMIVSDSHIHFQVNDKDLGYPQFYRHGQESTWDLLLDQDIEYVWFISAQSDNSFQLLKA